MKIALLPHTYFPDVVGGTEFYVADLANELIHLGHEVWILAPGAEENQTVVNGAVILRYKVPLPKDTVDLYRQSCRAVGDWFSAWLDREKPDIVHFHAVTRGQSVEMYEEVKRRRIPLIVTCHTLLTCARGSMLLWGREACDGLWKVDRCTACAAHSRKLPSLLGWLLTLVPKPVSRTLSKIIPGKFGTALGLPEYIERFIKMLQNRFEMADAIIVPCDWMKNVLLLNTIQSKKIHFCRQGVTAQTDRIIFKGGNKSLDEPMVIGFIGRLDYYKGLEVLLSAVQKLPPSCKIRVDIYGIRMDTGFEHSIMNKIAGDERLRLFPPVAHERIYEVLRTFDILAVPSLWLETGPLVVKEAFAVGIPVIGSDHGGVSELVKHDDNGILVKSGSIEAWTTAIQRLCLNRPLLNRLASHTKEPVTMRDVAGQMEQLYEKLLQTFRLQLKG